MLTTLMLGAWALAVPAPQAWDTTFAAAADARIEVENQAGEVVVDTWDRNAVRVTARPGDRARVVIGGSDREVRIRSEAHGGSVSIAYRVTVPAAAALRITGPFNDVSIDGAGAEVYVETVRGDVDVRGGVGLVSLRSVDGRIVLEGARGDVRIDGVNGEIHLADVTGEIAATAVNGSIRLERIESRGVEAATVNGDVSYTGTILERGRYRLSTHNGDVAITLPEGVDATLSVATFNGEVESAVPLPLSSLRRGERFHATLGKGGAEIELESFNGTIHIQRPGGAENSEEP
ncbi:MAG TPA: DUF4097 family beta strand repeat-containing protein [Longimicrobiales bacterium]